MMKRRDIYFLIFSVLILLFVNISVTFSVFGQDSIGKWRRHVISLPNNTYVGNPFELEVDATFTHSGSGTTITLPGYYAGNNTWKIGFMPTEIGEWTYSTSSSDPDLNAKTGSLNAVESGNPGMLKADITHAKKWKYTDGNYAIPLIFLFDVAQESGSIQRFTEIANFLKNDIKGHMFDFRITNEGMSPRFPTFEGSWQNHEFNLSYWDQLEQRMEILAQRGLGIYLMFYSDDGGKPPWLGQSATEALFIRYTIARLAGYPVVWFDTGIDISEYRSQSDIDWLGAEVRSLDPYDHPISSRHGGGSGKMRMAGRTYDSLGYRYALINDMRSYFQSASIPVSMNDAFMEEADKYPSRNFKKEDIRRAAWKAVVAGGLGMIVRSSNLYNKDLYFRMSNFESDLESEQWLQLVNPFIQTKFGNTFGQMVPEQSLVSNGHVLADPARTKILYFLMGKNDRWDSEDGGPITAKLSSVSGNYSATWFNPRTGSEIALGILPGGGDHVITPPSTDDWVLLLTVGPTDNTPPSTPSDLNATSQNENQINLTWQAASDPESGISKYNIYRDGSNVGQSTTTSFSDTGLNEGTTYSYEVSAVNGAGMEGAKSTSVSATTLADTNQPTISSVSASGDSTIVTIVFSESVEQASATNASNYQINNGITVSSASLNSDLKAVTLTTSPHNDEITYSLTVNNVRDRATNPNTIAPNTTASYQYIGMNTFDADSEGWTYNDDTFRSTTSPSSADGQWDASEGNDGGTLVVALGGNTKSATSGGWSKSVTSTESDLPISFDYKLDLLNTVDGNEYGEVIVSVDDNQVGILSNDYVVQLEGNGRTLSSTGWVTVTVTAANIGAGSHEVIIGGYMSGKSSSSEKAVVYIDNVKINVSAPIDTTPPATPTGLTTQ